jgi:hypothetical protein
LLTAAAAEIHPVLRAGAKIVIAEFSLDVGVGVAHALAVLGSVLPIVARSIDINWAIYNDVVIAPVAPTTPIVSA